MSETNELASALAAAQGMFTNPERNRTVKVQTKTGGSYTFTYATLDAIMDMIRAPLAANGLAISHVLAQAPIGWCCITRLLHSSGQSIECPVPIIVDESANAQGWGSAITYAKRYGLCALLAITADEDDDGNAGCGNQATQQPRKPAAKTETPKQAFAAPATKPFEWKSATSPERLAYVKRRIAEVNAMSDPVQATNKLHEMAKWIGGQGASFTPEDGEAVNAALLDAEKAINDITSGQ